MPLLVASALILACGSDDPADQPDGGTAGDGGTSGDAEPGADGGGGNVANLDLLFSTFLNPEPGAGYSELWEPVFDSQGNIIVAGVGEFADPNVGNPYQGVTATIFDADGALDQSSFMIAKLSPTGVPLWFAFLDSTGPEKEIDGLALDSNDNVIVSGVVAVGDFPTTSGAFDETINNSGVVNQNGDAFVAKISADGQTLMFSTFLGGQNGDSTSRGGIAVADDDSIYVVGHTKADDFLSNPSSGDTVVFKNSYRGGVGDGFMLQLSADGSDVLWAGFVGSANEPLYGDVLLSVELGPGGKPHVTGLVYGNDVVTTPGTHSNTYAGGTGDFYAARFSTGGDLEWATFIGGDNDDGPEHGLRVDDDGSMVFGGFTLSNNFPTVAAHQSTAGGSGDGLLVKLDNTGNIVFSTYIGGSNPDSSIGVGIDSGGRIIIGGNTDSTDFETTPGSFDETHNGDQDTFVRIYAADGSLLYSTLIGGGANDRTRYATTAPDGDVVLVGGTDSADFPTSAGAFDSTQNGGRDVFVTRFDVTWSN